MPYSFRIGYSKFLLSVIERSRDFTVKGSKKKNSLGNLFATSGFITLLEAPLSIKIFKPKLGTVIKGSFGLLFIEFKSTLATGLEFENFRWSYFLKYFRFDNTHFDHSLGRNFHFQHYKFLQL